MNKDEVTQWNPTRLLQASSDEIAREVFSTEIAAIQESGDGLEYTEAITRVAMAKGITVTTGQRFAIMAGMHHARMSGADALRAANVLLHDPDIDAKVRYQRKGQDVLLSAADFRRALESLPRRGVRYGPDDIREFIRLHGYKRTDFPVVGHEGDNNERIHKYIPYAEVAEKQGGE